MHIPPQAPHRRALAAVTGLGAVTACGVGVAGLFADLGAGRSPFTRAPIAPVANALPRPADASFVPPRPVLAGHVTVALPLADAIGARADRALSRDARLLTHAARQARDAAGAARPQTPERTAVYLGTLRAGRSEYLAIHDASGGRGRRVNPVWGPGSGYNAAAAQLSVVFDAQGPNITLCAGTAVGLAAVVAAARAVDAGMCDTAYAAGLDTLCETPDAALSEAADSVDAVVSAGPAGSADSADSADSAGAGGGVPLGEAAAALVLEAGPQAAGRALARITAVAEAAATGGPQAFGWAQAVRDAVRGVLGDRPQDREGVDLAVLVGTGDGRADRAVRTAVGALLPAAALVEVATTTGRSGGADGALAAVVAVEALRRGRSPLPDGGPVRGPALCLGADPDGRVTALLLDRAPGGGPDADRDEAAARAAREPAAGRATAAAGAEAGDEPSADPSGGPGADR